LPTNAHQLAEMLALTRKQMALLYNQDDLVRASRWIEVNASHRAENGKGLLFHAIQRLTNDYDEGQITRPQLIDEFGKAVLHSKEVPSVYVYVMLIKAFSRARSFALAYHASWALRNSTLPLTDVALVYVLYQMAHDRDARSFNKLMDVIALKSNPVNMMEPWDTVQADGMNIPVPRSLNPRLLMILAHTALQCSQPHRAEAWMTLLRELDYGGKWKDDVFKSFLRYYAVHGDWKRGMEWLARSVRHALSIAALSMDRFKRVIFRMLVLCVMCGKHHEYTEILEAAVHSGIGPPKITRSKSDTKKIHPRTWSIQLEWNSFPIPDDIAGYTDEMKIKSFQYACRPLTEELAEPPSQEESVKARKDPQVETGLMTSRTHKHQRYAVQNDASANLGNVTAQLEALQAKFVKQDTLLSEMKARLDTSVIHWKEYDQIAAERSRAWSEGVSRLGEQFRTLSEQVESLKRTTVDQEDRIRQLGLRSGQASQLHLTERKAAASTKDAVEQTAKELADLKSTIEKLQELQEASRTDRLNAWYAQSALQRREKESAEAVRREVAKALQEEKAKVKTRSMTRSDRHYPHRATTTGMLEARLAVAQYENNHSTASSPSHYLDTDGGTETPSESDVSDKGVTATLTSLPPAIERESEDDVTGQFEDTSYGDNTAAPETNHHSHSGDPARGQAPAFDSSATTIDGPSDLHIDEDPETDLNPRIRPVFKTFDGGRLLRKLPSTPRKRGGDADETGSDSGYDSDDASRRSEVVTGVSGNYTMKYVAFDPIRKIKSARWRDDPTYLDPQIGSH
jgi:hypothetical protein